MSSYAPFDGSPAFAAPVPSSPRPQPSGSGGASSWVIVPQTKIAFIGYVLLTVAMIIYVIQSPQIGIAFIPNIILYVIIYLIALYVINCTVVGKCNLYAWIVSYVVVVLGILSIVGLVMALTKR